MKGGFGGIISGRSDTEGSTSPFLRFFKLGAFPFPIELELGNRIGCTGSGSGRISIWGSGDGGGSLTFRGGGEFEGCEEGGDMDVISTDGERARLMDD